MSRKSLKKTKTSGTPANKPLSSKPVPKSGIRKKIGWFLLPVLLLTLFAYLPGFDNEWVNWDDPTYVLENEEITELTGESVLFQFRDYHHGNYHPLTMISYMIDYHFSELDAGLYHFNNILFHLLNTTLVFFLFFLLTGKLSVAVIVAALFGVHPMHVESVAWISERKDVLYGFFYLLSMIFYVRYIKKGANHTMLLAGVFCFFLLSLLSKAMAVTLPLVMLLFDYMMKREFSKKLLLEKIPFFILSIIFGLIAIEAQKSSEAIASFEVFAVHHRFLFAFYGILYYMYELLLPLNLSGFHPYPFLIVDRLPYIYYFAPLIVLALLVLVYLSMKKTRAVVFGFLFYLITVSLVLQFISVGKAIVADRYTYIPYIGLFFVIGQGYEYMGGWNKRYQKLLTLVLAGGVLFFAWWTHEYCKTWKDGESLWTNVIDKYPHVYDGYFHRGSFLAKENRYDEAMKDFNQAIQMAPGNGKTYIYRGNIYGMRGQHDLALADYNKAETLNADNFDIYINRAITYSIRKDYPNAFKDYEKALSYEPGNSKIYLNRAYAYMEYGELDKAIDDCNKVLSTSNVNSVRALVFRGMVYQRKKAFDKALADFNRVLQFDPNHGNAYLQRSSLYVATGEYSQALQDAMKAQQLGMQVNEAFIANIRQKLGR